MTGDVSDDELQQLFVLLWERSTRPVVQQRIEPRAEAEVNLQPLGTYLMLETMSDPEKKPNKVRVFAPTWSDRTHGVELISESMPFWIVGVRASEKLVLLTPREAAQKLLKKRVPLPEPDEILRWHVAAAEHTP